MRKDNMKIWLSVVLSAVILGLSVTYFMHATLPQSAVDWVLWVLVALVAIRSIMRIAVLAKQAGREQAGNDEE